MAPRLDPQDAEAVLRIVEGDALDRPGQDLPVRRSPLPAGAGLHDVPCRCGGRRIACRSHQLPRLSPSQARPWPAAISAAARDVPSRIRSAITRPPHLPHAGSRTTTSDASASAAAVNAVAACPPARSLSHSARPPVSGVSTPRSRTLRSASSRRQVRRGVHRHRVAVDHPHHGPSVVGGHGGSGQQAGERPGQRNGARVHGSISGPRSGRARSIGPPYSPASSPVVCFAMKASLLAQRPASDGLSARAPGTRRRHAARLRPRAQRRCHAQRGRVARQAGSPAPIALPGGVRWPRRAGRAPCAAER